MHRYSVQFRISGTNVIPSEITRGLDLQPNQIRIIGEKRSGDRTWDESLWSYDGTSNDLGSKEWESLEDGLLFVLNKLLPKKDLIRNYVENSEAIWWCGHFQSSFNGGPELSASLLRQLADFGVPLFLDNYFGNEQK